MLGDLFRFLASFFGTIMVASLIISLVVSAIERVHLTRKIRAEKNRAQKEIKEGGGSVKVYARFRRIAVVTGASSGLGRAYVKLIDQKSWKYNVDEIWLIARRQDRLKELAGEIRLPSRVICMDLCSQEEIEAFGQKLAAQAQEYEEFSVSLLINCAGFGSYGASEKLGHRTENRMIDLNDKAAISMTDICLPYMKAGSRIMQVCSVAAFQPIVHFGAYAASKALLYTYSRSQHIELLGRGIGVTAVCPYWIYDTEFIDTASIENKKPFLSSKSQSVAKISLHDALYGHAVSTPGIVCTAERIFAGLIPDGLLGYITSRFL